MMMRPPPGTNRAPARAFRPLGQAWPLRRPRRGPWPIAVQISKARPFLRGPKPRLQLAALFDDELAKPALSWIMFELLVPNLADAALWQRQGRREYAQIQRFDEGRGYAL